MKNTMMVNNNTMVDNRAFETHRAGENKAFKAINKFYPELKGICTDTWIVLYKVHREILTKETLGLLDYIKKEVDGGKKVEDESFSDDIKNYKFEIILRTVNRYIDQMPSEYNAKTFVKFCESAINDGLSFYQEYYF